MDPLDFLEAEELLRFFHIQKTEMSCMENPCTFLSQLRDHNLIPEDSYKKVSRMKSKEGMKKAIYDILDWLETERSEHIHLFWSCVFKETILNHYPTLRQLRNSLMDGSFHFPTKLPEKVGEEETNKRKKRELSEGEEEEEEEEEQVNSVKKKKKKREQRSGSACEDEEQPGPSTQLTPRQRRKKICFSPTLKKGEKSDIWTWPLYRHLLPVSCGCKEGTLNRERLEKGEKCILSEKQWFTPAGFERLAGKESSKNWKLSIRCTDVPLATLIKEGHLKSANFKGRHKRETKRTTRSLFPSDQSVTEEEEDENEGEESDLSCQEDQLSCSDVGSPADATDEDGETAERTEQQPEAGGDRGKRFQVTCGNVAGTLHQKRFGSGTCGKCIRTETGWFTPVEFVKEATDQQDATWKKDIKWEGKPFSALIEAEILKIHSPLCPCRLCSPHRVDLENQKNDDECCICKSEGEAKLVVCDDCPRSFHQKCHLPHVDNIILRDVRKWLCTFCVYQANQNWRDGDEVEMSAALSLQISGHMLECQYLVLYLCCADEEQTFASDPSVYLQDYSRLVRTPMWLGNIADKLQKKEYHTVGEFVSDVQLIFTNCATYNRGNAEFLDMGSRLKELFDGEFTKVFNIRGHDG